ncbi:hypothetical protein KY359_02120 [Candidatus Woesearchaeota archaeon]|nr:hypothetical protein [Candidatus Woesearchaeota archaeon]
MVFDTINEVFRNIGTGEWAVDFSPGSVKAVLILCVVGIFICMALGLWSNYHKRRGHFTHPTAHPGEHLGHIVQLINSALHELYRKNHLTGPGISTADVSFMKWGALSVKVWSFELNRKDQVTRGNFGHIHLNRHFFTVHTRHQHYALNIAAQLLHFQKLAMSGSDPRAIQDNNSAIKKGGDAVLAKAGLLHESDSLRDNAVFSLIRHDRKVDEKIADTLDISEKDAKHIEEAMEQSGKGGSDDATRMMNWINREIGHFKELLKLMEDKKKTMDRIFSSEKKKMSSSDASRMQSIIDQWDLDMTRIGWIFDALENIRKNSHRWSFNVIGLHNWRAMKVRDLNDAAGKLDVESVKGTININNVRALVTSLTAERGRIMQMMHEEEGLYAS